MQLGRLKVYIVREIQFEASMTRRLPDYFLSQIKAEVNRD
jgi:hypothetical protein